MIEVQLSPAVVVGTGLVGASVAQALTQLGAGVPLNDVLVRAFGGTMAQLERRLGVALQRRRWGQATSEDDDTVALQGSGRPAPGGSVKLRSGPVPSSGTNARAPATGVSSTTRTWRPGTASSCPAAGSHPGSSTHRASQKCPSAFWSRR